MSILSSPDNIQSKHRAQMKVIALPVCNIGYVSVKCTMTWVKVSESSISHTWMSGIEFTWSGMTLCSAVLNGGEQIENLGHLRFFPIWFWCFSLWSENVTLGSPGLLICGEVAIGIGMLHVRSKPKRRRPFSQTTASCGIWCSDSCIRNWPLRFPSFAKVNLSDFVPFSLLNWTTWPVW